MPTAVYQLLEFEGAASSGATATTRMSCFGFSRFDASTAVRAVAPMAGPSSAPLDITVLDEYTKT
jgi:hypothetical protein